MRRDILSPAQGINRLTCSSEVTFSSSLDTSSVRSSIDNFSNSSQLQYNTKPYDKIQYKTK